MAPANTGLRVLSRPGHPDFLDLPWHQRLEDWDDPRLVEVVRGVHRHVVRFVDEGGRLYALKELPRRLAEREYRLLRRAAAEELPVVEAVGVVNRGPGTGGEPLEDVLITRYLDFSLPYRAVFVHRRRADVDVRGTDVRGFSDRLLDALAMLLVRLHLMGFFWGDCSLSNTLFRRDAGALAAYLVDLETGEWHPSLSDGQRGVDLDLTESNVVGGLLDLQAELGVDDGPDPADVAEDLRNRYDRLWAELTDEEVIRPSERHRIEARIRRLNELGFDVDEIEVVSDPEESDGEGRLHLRPIVTEAGHHRRRLQSLTGLEAQENQARSMLNDMNNFRIAKEAKLGRPISQQVAAYQWLTEVFEPTVAAIPTDATAKLEPAELFCEVIEHKWYLSELSQRDIGVRAAVRSYMQHVLPTVPDERRLLTDADDASSGWIGYG